jgi:hypothetical protein
MEPKSPSPYSQVPATCPYPEPTPIPTIPSDFPMIHLIIILPSTSGSPQWPLSLRFPHQHPVHISLLPHTSTCPAHLILLDFTTRTILGKEYRSFTSSLCNFYLHEHQLHLFESIASCISKEILETAIQFCLQLRIVIL